MNRNQMTPYFTDHEGARRLIVEQPQRIVRLIHFGTAASTPSTIVQPAIVDGEHRLDHEFMLSASEGGVHKVATHESFGRVERSTWRDGVLLRLTLNDTQDLREGARLAYCYLFEWQGAEGWKAVRYTNFVPRLLDADGDGTENRYMQFNAGRFTAWAERGPKLIDGRLSYRTVDDERWRPYTPAATGIGTKEGSLVIEAWFAPPGSHVRHVQNGLQTAPVDYESRYGALPPIFARGTYLKTAEGAGFIISGTASVRGSTIVHDPAELLAAADGQAPEAVLEQCLRRQADTTCDLIAHLLSAENLRAQGVDDGFELGHLTGVRVYLKYPEHASALREVLARRLGSTPAIVVEADVCRDGWLVEIEGLAFKSV